MQQSLKNKKLWEIVNFNDAIIFILAFINVFENFNNIIFKKNANFGLEKLNAKT